MSPLHFTAFTKSTCKRCQGSGHEMDWFALGEHLRNVREEKGWSLRDVETVVGCSRAHISDIENGNRKPTGPAGLRYLKLLNVQHPQIPDSMRPSEGE